GSMERLLRGARRGEEGRGDELLDAGGVLLPRLVALDAPFSLAAAAGPPRLRDGAVELSISPEDAEPAVLKLRVQEARVHHGGEVGRLEVHGLPRARGDLLARLAVQLRLDALRRRGRAQRGVHLRVAR